MDNDLREVNVHISTAAAQPQMVWSIGQKLSARTVDMI